MSIREWKREREPRRPKEKWKEIQNSGEKKKIGGTFSVCTFNLHNAIVNSMLEYFFSVSVSHSVFGREFRYRFEYFSLFFSCDN